MVWKEWIESVSHETDWQEIQNSQNEGLLCTVHSQFQFVGTGYDDDH